MHAGFDRAKSGEDFGGQSEPDITQSPVQAGFPRRWQHSGEVFLLVSSLINTTEVGP